MQVLMVYIEPAPYILDLIRVMGKEHPGIGLRVFFITSSCTQVWGSKLDDGISQLLPVGKLAAARKLFAEIRKGDFDWLHLAGWGHPLMMFALLVGGAFRRKISVESDTQLPQPLAGVKERLKKLLYPWLFSLADILFPGGARQREYFRHYGVPDYKIRIAQMTVDVRRIMAMAEGFHAGRVGIRESMGLKVDDLVFVYVGRLESYKGIRLLLEAFAHIGLDGARLLLVGDGSERVLVDAAAANDGRIRYLGRRNFEGVVAAFSISDVAIVPSELDSWGLVVNEAMAAGLPVIATDRIGAVDDMVIDGDTGIIVPAGNSNKLQEAMCCLARDSQLRQRMGSAALELIQRWRKEDEAERLVRGWQAGGAS